MALHNNYIALFVGTFPPRKCGIATFTKDLTEAIDSAGTITKIFAINESETSPIYSEKVVHKTSVYDYETYLKIAEEINNNKSIKLVCIQHEFGIFGGEKSCHPIPFLEKLNKPVIINFHSVFPNPQEEVKSLVRSIAQRVKMAVVMTKTAVKLLKEDYGINTPISIIPHGIPEVGFESQKFSKLKLGISNRKVLSSFGMVGPGKGYEHIIESLPKVVKIFPDVLYLLIGASHPKVIEEEGETYRESLIKKISKLGLEKNVAFHNEYATLSQIIEYLKATDIYISSSQNPEQITSGTLVYAMGCGRAVISTPFPHALDILNEDNGIIVDFGVTKKYADAIIELLSNREKTKRFERNNYELTRPMIWSNVGKTYSQLIESLLTKQPILEEAKMKPVESRAFREF
jgi:glycosyltransferase involved in cell wall biosynthesis